MNNETRPCSLVNGSKIGIGILPAEIITEVFFLVLEVYDPLKWDWDRVKDLACVCPQFLEIIKDSPLLWPKLDAKDGPALSTIVRRRNTTGPLAFVYEQPDSTDNDFLNSHLTQTRSRWTRLVWTGEADPRPHRATEPRPAIEPTWARIRAALEEPTPLMTHITLIASRKNDVQEFLLGDGAPIVSMTLCQVLLPGGSCPRIHSLHTLDLKLQLDAWAKLTFSKLMDAVEGALKQLTQLVVLDMRITSQRLPMERDSNGRSSIHLPRLDYLKLEGAVSTSRFNLLSRLEIPNCRYLKAYSFMLGKLDQWSGGHTISSLLSILQSSRALVIRLAFYSSVRCTLRIQSVSISNDRPSKRYEGQPNLSIRITSQVLPIAQDRIMPFLRSTIRSEAKLGLHVSPNLDWSDDNWDLFYKIFHQYPRVYSICLAGSATSRALQCIISWMESGDPFLEDLNRLSIGPLDTNDIEGTVKELEELRRVRASQIALPRPEGDLLHPLVITIPGELFKVSEIITNPVDSFEAVDTTCSCDEFLTSFR